MNEKPTHARHRLIVVSNQKNMQATTTRYDFYHKSCYLYSFGILSFGFCFDGVRYQTQVIC